MKILTVFGTRPEAIKLAPVIKAFEAESSIESVTCVTAQHRKLLDQVLKIFHIIPDFDLNLMKPNQSLSFITTAILEKMEDVLQEVQPDYVLVQGDTTTVFTAALSAFYKKIKVAHLEGGLRTDDLYSPWPEEGNRRLVSAISSVNFVPTSRAENNLLKENIPRHKIFLTGNTVIDALLSVKERIATDKILEKKLEAEFLGLSRSKKIILITLHRRESHGDIIRNLCHMIKKFVKDRPDVQFVFSLHPNPNVQDMVNSILKNCDNVMLLQPLSYLSFVYLMSQSYLTLTDSGGVQEEAPSLNKPVLVAREKTERIEGIEAGCSILVGTNPEKIRKILFSYLDDETLYNKCINRNNPYGEGNSSKKIVEYFKACCT